LGKRRLKAIAQVDSLTLCGIGLQGRLKAMTRVDSLILCGIGLQGTIAWVLFAFRHKDNCTHRDKVTLHLFIERRPRKAHGLEYYSCANNPPNVIVTNKKSHTHN
jgi:hypothetical protein